MGGATPAPATVGLPLHQDPCSRTDWLAEAGQTDTSAGVHCQPSRGSHSATEERGWEDELQAAAAMAMKESPHSPSLLTPPSLRVTQLTFLLCSTASNAEGQCGPHTAGTDIPCSLEAWPSQRPLSGGWNLSLIKWPLNPGSRLYHPEPHRPIHRECWRIEGSRHCSAQHP